MEIIVGTITVRDGKILMVREAKKHCYSKWAFPAGHLEKNETVFEGAQRETTEETGCKVELKKAFPVLIHNSNKRNLMMFHFLSDIIEEGTDFDKDEILETRWIPISELKTMKKEEFRGYSVIKSILENLDNNNYYNLDMVEDMNL